MTISWKWFWITVGIVLTIGLIIGFFLCLKLNPCPEIEVKKVRIETSVEVPPQKIIEEGVKKAEIRVEKQPEVYYIKEEIKGSWRTNFIISKENYQGDLFVEFMLPDSLFEYRLDLDINPDTIRSWKYVNVEIPVPVKIPKIKFLYAYLGGGISFSSDENTKLHIEGGCADVGICIKKTWLIYGSIDSYRKIWLKTGFLF